MKKKLLFLIIIMMSTILVYLIIDKFNFSNCSEAIQKGHKNIKSDNIFYRKNLDKNKNGIACEL